MKLDHCIATLQTLNEDERGPFRHFAPVPKVVLLVGFLALIVSFGRYDWAGTFSLALVPYILAILGGLSPWFILKRACVALPFVLCAGAANCFFDSPTGGAISLGVLAAKTFGTVGGVLLLTLTTSMSGITGALAALRVPCLLILQIQFMFRYLLLAMEEAQRVTSAYRLRNPECGLIPMRDWGQLAGQLFIRTVRRGNAVYAAMQCRLFSARTPVSEAQRARKREWGVVLLLLLAFGAVRWFL